MQKESGFWEWPQAVKDGRTRWDCILSYGFMVAGGQWSLLQFWRIMDRPEEVLDCWYQHFKEVLNVQSIYDNEVVAATPALETILHLNDPPYDWGAGDCLVLLKVRKAGGSFQRLFCVVVLFCVMGCLLWCTARLCVGNWKDVVIVPVSKKGTSNPVTISLKNWWVVLFRNGFRWSLNQTQSVGKRLCGHGQMVDGEDKRAWGITVYDVCGSQECSHGLSWLSVANKLLSMQHMQH